MAHKHCKARNDFRKAEQLLKRTQEKISEHNIVQMEELDDQIGRAIQSGLKQCRKIRMGAIYLSQIL